MLSLLKFFAFIFTALTVVALGHDAWRAYDTGNDFSFSQIGGLIQTYAKSEHDAAREAIVDTAGAETFNDTLVPVLRLYTVALFGGLAALFWGLFGLVKFGRREKQMPRRYRAN